MTETKKKKQEKQIILSLIVALVLTLVAAYLPSTIKKEEKSLITLARKESPEMILRVERICSKKFLDGMRSNKLNIDYSKCFNETINEIDKETEIGFKRRKNLQKRRELYSIISTALFGLAAFFLIALPFLDDREEDEIEGQ